MTSSHYLALDLSRTDTENLFFWKENVYKLVNHHYVPKQPFKLARVLSRGRTLWETDGASFGTKVIVCHAGGSPLLLHVRFVSHGLQEVAYFASNLARRGESGSDAGLESDLDVFAGTTGVFTEGFNYNSGQKRGYHSGAAHASDRPRAEWSRVSAHEFYLRFHRLVAANQVLKEVELALGRPDPKAVFLNRSGRLLVDVYVPNVGHRLRAVRDGMRDVWRAPSPNVRCTTVFAHPKASYSYLHLVIEGYVEGSFDSDGCFCVNNGEGTNGENWFGEASFGDDNHSNGFGGPKTPGRYFKTDLFFKKAFLRWNRISRTDYFNFFELDFGRTGLNNEPCDLGADLYCYYYKKVGLNLEELSELLQNHLESTPDTGNSGSLLRRKAGGQDARFSELEAICERFHIAQNHFHALTNVFVTPKAGFLLTQLELDSFRLAAGADELVLYLNLHYYLGRLASFYLILRRREGEAALYFLRRESAWVSVSFSQYMASFSHFSYFAGLAPGALPEGACPGSAANGSSSEAAAAERAVTRLGPELAHPNADQPCLRTASCPPGPVSVLECSAGGHEFPGELSKTSSALNNSDPAKLALDLNAQKLPRTYSMLSTKSTSRSSSFSLTRRGKVLSSGSLARLRSNLSTLKYSLINFRHHLAGLSARRLPGPGALGPQLLSKNMAALSARNAARQAAPVRAPPEIRLADLLRKRGKDESFAGRVFCSSFRNKKNLLIRTYFSPAENAHPRRAFRYRLLRGAHARWQGYSHEPSASPVRRRSAGIPLSRFGASNDSENECSSGANSSDSDAAELVSAVSPAIDSLSGSRSIHAHLSSGVDSAVGAPTTFNRGWPTRRPEPRLSRRTRLRNRLARMHRRSLSSYAAPANRLFNASGKLSGASFSGSDGALYSGSGKLFSRSRLFPRTRGHSSRNVVLVGGLASTFLEAFMSVDVDRFLQSNDYLNLNPYLNYVPKFSALAALYAPDASPRPCSDCSLTRLDAGCGSAHGGSGHDQAGCANALHDALLLLARKCQRKYGELFNASCYYGDDLLDVFRGFSYRGSFVEMLNRLGYNVYSLDLQSHGLSEGARDLKCFSESFQDYVDDLVQFLGIVKAGRFFDNAQTYSAFGPERGGPFGGAFSYFPVVRGEYVLVGFSMGANIAVQAIMAHSAGAARSLDSGHPSPSAPLNVVDKFISVNGMYNLRDLCGRVGRFMFPFFCRITSFFAPHKIAPGGVSRDYASSFRVYKSFQDAYYYVDKHRHLKCSQLFRACDAVFRKIRQYPSTLRTLIVHSINDNRCHINGANRLFENINNSCNDYVPVNSDFHSITNYEFVGIMRDIISKILVQ